jgi:8-oxo-dGTP pyrophosphatase MutT (NUDIX family)
MNQVIEYVGVILVDDQDRIALQLREQDRELNPDRWSVFGGHIERSEKSEQAAIREINEELSVSLSREKMEYIGRFARNDHAYHMYFYPVSHELDNAELKEGCHWQWCSLEEIREGVVGGKEIVEYHARFLLQFLEGRSTGKTK